MIFDMKLECGESVTVSYAIDKELDSGKLFVSWWCFEEDNFMPFPMPEEVEVLKACMEDFQTKLHLGHQERANMLGDW